MSPLLYSTVALCEFIGEPQIRWGREGVPSEVARCHAMQARGCDLINVPVCLALLQ